MIVKGVAGRPVAPFSQPDHRKIPKYKRTPMITKDGYAAVPWYDTKYVILYNGQQIADVNSAAEAVAYIRNQQKNTKSKTTKRRGKLPLEGA